MASNIEVIVYSARTLSKVKECNPDTFCVISFGNEKYCTDVVKNSRSPVWSSISNFNNVDKLLKKRKDIKVTCFTAKKTFLGKVRIPSEKLMEVSYIDEWFPLKDKNNKPDANLTGDLHLKIVLNVPGFPTPRASRMKSQEIEKAQESEKRINKETPKSAILSPPKSDANSLFEFKKKLEAKKSDNKPQVERKAQVERKPQVERQSQVESTNPFMGRKKSTNPFDDDEEEISLIGKHFPPAASIEPTEEILALERETEKIRDQSLQSTKRCLQSLSASERTGAESLMTLEGQGKQLKAISKDLDEVENNLEEGKRQIRGISSVWGAAANKFNFRKKVEGKQIPQLKKLQERRSSTSVLMEIRKKNTLESRSFSVSTAEELSPEIPRDQVEQNLDQMSFKLKNLKAMATSFSTEIADQGKTLDEIDTKVEKSNADIKTQRSRLRQIRK